MIKRIIKRVVKPAIAIIRKVRDEIAWARIRVDFKNSVRCWR